MKKTPEQEEREALNNLARADQAKELLSNPLYVEAINAMQAAMFAEFEDSKLDEESKRHELWQRMQLLKQFRGRFEHIVKTGNKAKQTLTMLQKAKQTIGIR